MTRRTLGCLVLALSVTGGVALQAHHSLAGVYDMKGERELVGTIVKILFVNPAHCGVHQIGGRDERVPSARTTARTRSYGRASSTMLKGPCAARRTWRKPPPSFSTSVNFASPAWAPRPSPTSCASDVGTQIMVEAL